MKIGIYFGDNDFWRTVTSFLDLLEEGKDNHHRGLTLEERYTKERILYLFNESANVIYLIKQNGFCYNLDSKIDGLKEYLTIDIKDIYINEEVDEMNKQDNDACFHYIEIK